MRYSSSYSVSISCEGAHTDSEEEFNKVESQHLLPESDLLTNFLDHLALVLELLFLQKGLNLILKLKTKRDTRGTERRRESREFPNPNLPISLKNPQRKIKGLEPGSTKSIHLAIDPVLLPQMIQSKALHLEIRHPGRILVLMRYFEFNSVLYNYVFPLYITYYCT